MMLASFDWLYARWPDHDRSPCRSSKSMRPWRCASEETVTTRAGALSMSRSTSRWVSRNGARWLSAKVRSRPSAVTCRLFQKPPTLLTRTSSRGSDASTSAASRRTSAWLDMSATKTSTGGPPSARISAAAASARPRSRPVIATRAPRAARPAAVALPMPWVPPVTRTVRPAICPVSIMPVSLPVPAPQIARSPKGRGKGAARGPAVDHAAGMTDSSGPPFRADHVGSLLRPANLLDARARHAVGEIDDAELRGIEDEAIADVVRLQRDVGLRTATDGEFRRASWHMDFIYRIEGITRVEQHIAVHFRNADGTI